MATLTPQYVQELLSSTKQRGVYEVTIGNHVSTGEIALNVSELAYFKGKEVNAVRNSFNGNIEKKSEENGWPALSVVIDKNDAETGERTKDTSKWSVILVNMDALTAAMAEDEV